MNQIDLRHFDLNLLVVFDVLMTERNVTRAAERLGRTQSAVSHSLSRLREQFGDPLLTKGGARMQPTALALDLIEQARPMLGGIQRVLSPQHIFDAASSRRVFRLAAPATIDRSRRGTRQARARSRNSASLARPSSAGATTEALTTRPPSAAAAMPPPACVSTHRRCRSRSASGSAA